jgi:hypothetical protein
MGRCDRGGLSLKKVNFNEIEHMKVLECGKIYINFDYYGDEELKVGDVIKLLYLGTVVKVTTADVFYQSKDAFARNEIAGITIEGVIA